MHLAIDAQELAVGVDDGGGVVVNAGGALLEERGDDDNAVLLREFLALAAVDGPGIGSASLVIVIFPDRSIASEKVPACR